MLRFLQFELQQEDADSCTFEAMASVKAPDVLALETEGRLLLAHLPTWLGTHPSPLDRGGDWDVWFQAHWDGQPPLTVDAHVPCWASAPTTETSTPSTAWWTLNITLVVSAQLVPSLTDHLAL